MLKANQIIFNDQQQQQGAVAAAGSNIPLLILCNNSNKIYESLNDIDNFYENNNEKSGPIDIIYEHIIDDDLVLQPKINYNYNKNYIKKYPKMNANV